MPYLESFAEDANQGEVFKRWPEVSRHLVALAQQLLCDGPLPRALAELIFTYVSHLNNCEYAFEIHRHAAEMLGADAQLLDAIVKDINDASIDDRTRTLLLFVKKLTGSPSAVTRADANDVLNAGWNEDEFHYAVSICAFTNYMNRSLSGHGIVGDSEHWKKSGQAIAELEYSKFIPR